MLSLGIAIRLLTVVHRFFCVQTATASLWQPWVHCSPAGDSECNFGPPMPRPAQIDRPSFHAGEPLVQRIGPWSKVVPTGSAADDTVVIAAVMRLLDRLAALHVRPTHRPAGLTVDRSKLQLVPTKDPADVAPTDSFTLIVECSLLCDEELAEAETSDDEVWRPRLWSSEAYQLDVRKDAPEAVLRADGRAGLLHGLELVAQLSFVTAANRGEPGALALPVGTVRDRPSFAWRGLLLDVSRHFLPYASLLRAIDGCAVLRINVLHLHLCDDQVGVPSTLFPQGSGPPPPPHARARGPLTRRRARAGASRCRASPRCTSRSGPSRGVYAALAFSTIS
jgi:hypothetical protein